MHLEQGARDQARDAAGARPDDDQDASDPGRDDERDGDQGANDPRRDDERDDDQDALDPRQDIQARLRRAPHVIIADTYANRPDRTRVTVTKNQAGDTKKAVKRLGRG